MYVNVAVVEGCRLIKKVSQIKKYITLIQLYIPTCTEISLGTYDIYCSALQRVRACARERMLVSYISFSKSSKLESVPKSWRVSCELILLRPDALDHMGVTSRRQIGGPIPHSHNSLDSGRLLIDAGSSSRIFDGGILSRKLYR